MVITYFGGDCFRLQSGEVSVLLDPTNNRLKADLVVRTAAPVDIIADPARLSSATEIIFPGEYEAKGVEILGISLSGEASGKLVRTAYLLTWEDVKIAILPRAAKAPEGQALERLNEPDVLFIPLGDGGFSSESATKLMRELEPALAIPGHAKEGAALLKALGQKGEPQEKLVFKKKDLSGKKRQVVLLEAKT